jgi:4-carboxymuconolactone decarboxylase
MARSTRQQPHDPASFTPAQQAEFERLQINHHFGSDGYFHGPYDGWLLSGDLSRIVNQLVHYVQHDTTLDKGLSELVICIAGRWYEANLEWAGHALSALRNGVPQSVLDDLLAGRRPTGTLEQELAYDVSMALLGEHRLSDELYAQAVNQFGERGLMDIVATLGSYSLVSMTLDAFECKTAPAVPSVFPRDDTQTVSASEFWGWAASRLAAQRI